MGSSVAEIAVSPSDTRALRPGERMIAGRISIQNLDLLNLHEAYERVLSAPTILLGLSYDELSGLIASCQKVLSAPTFDLAALGYPVDLATAQRVFTNACEVRATRPEHQRAFAPVAPVAGRRAA